MCQVTPRTGCPVHFFSNAFFFFIQFCNFFFFLYFVIGCFWLTDIIGLFIPGRPWIVLHVHWACASGRISAELFRELSLWIAKGIREALTSALYSESLAPKTLTALVALHTTISKVLIISHFCKFILSAVLGLNKKFWHCQTQNSP